MRSSFIGLAALLTTNASYAGTIAGPLYNPANQHSYYLLSNNTWTASQIEARSLGGHLATINDAEEQAFVLENFGSYLGIQRLLWIGLNDVQTEGTFRWISGEPVTYTAWAPGEPNSVGNDEDFVALYYPNHSAGGLWNDWNNRTLDPIGLQFNGVVEVVPEPASMLGAVLITALWTRKRQKCSQVTEVKRGVTDNGARHTLSRHG